VLEERTPVAAEKGEDNLEIYPDPEEIHRRMLNKSRLNSRNDESVIKICEYLKVECSLKASSFSLLSINRHHAHSPA